MGNSRSSHATVASTEAVRIDKWLWAARFYKTRSLATQAIDAGHVRINAQRCKAARELKIGDQLEITRAPDLLEVVVLGLSTLRGPAPVAQTLYRETEDSMVRRQRTAELKRLVPAESPAGGRPTKRARREIERWTSGSGN